MKAPIELTVALVATALYLPQSQAALRSSIVRQGNQVVISWASDLGKTYALRRSDRPEGPWRVVSLQTAAEEPLSVTLPIEGTAAFFQLIEAPPNPDPANLIWIPPSTFTMGSPQDEVDRYDWEGPLTLVTLTRGYWIGKCEVTQSEYLAVIGTNPSSCIGDPRRPVETVTWSDATNYCTTLTRQEWAAGRMATNCAYRLPTEAEWEHACRAGTSTRFSYGDDPGYRMLPNYGWHYEIADWTPLPVGQRLPNPWGLYDMHGNVGEWVQNWYSELLPGGFTVDPQGPVTGSWRVRRGGSLATYARSCRSACRFIIGGPDAKDVEVGFRVVLAAVTP